MAMYVCLAAAVSGRALGDGVAFKGGKASYLCAAVRQSLPIADLPGK